MVEKREKKERGKNGKKKREKKREKKEKTEGNSGHYVIACSQLPEHRPLERRMLVPKKCLQIRGKPGISLSSYMVFDSVRI